MRVNNGTITIDSEQEFAAILQGLQELGRKCRKHKNQQHLQHVDDMITQMHNSLLYDYMDMYKRVVVPIVPIITPLSFKKIDSLAGAKNIG